VEEMWECGNGVWVVGIWHWWEMFENWQFVISWANTVPSNKSGEYEDTQSDW
jgi:hypothetical protein